MLIKVGFLGLSLPLLPAREITPFACHDSTRMKDIKDDQSRKHRQCVEDVQEGFMVGRVSCVTVGILCQAEDDSNLG